MATRWRRDRLQIEGEIRSLSAFVRAQQRRAQRGSRVAPMRAGKAIKKIRELEAELLRREVIAAVIGEDLGEYPGS